MNEIKETDVLVIGGGLSGLMATWQLQQAGVQATLLEARSRLGGRILTVETGSGANCDLGPSWVWPGQPLVASMLKHFNIAHYEQYAMGKIVFQDPDGSIHRLDHPSPMAGAWRIEGGIQSLTNAIADQLDTDRCFTEHVVTGISVEGDGIKVDVRNLSGGLQFQTGQVALAIPPRLVTGLSLTPELPVGAQQALAVTPTWMGSHAKFFAVYDRPFWREQGLCGTAISRVGPLAEIHDASPDSGDKYCLFGFVSLDAESRKKMGKQACIHQATSQLVTLFGESMASPTAVYLQDWSQEVFTASPADSQPLNRHPDYGLDLNLGADWQGKLSFISTESSFNHGGLLEGALEAGLRFAQGVSV